MALPIINLILAVIVAVLTFQATGLPL